MHGRHRRAVTLSVIRRCGTEGRPLTALCSPTPCWLAWRLACAGASRRLRIPRDRRCRPDRRGSECQHRRRASVQPGGGSRLPVPGVRRRHIQRQNEGSMACSSRNPQTCLAAGNDYRLVGLPGVRRRRQGHRGRLARHLLVAQRRPGLAKHAAAWLENRRPLLQGHHAGRLAGVNPIAGFEAAADPTLRAGTHGLFFLSGIAFNRAEETNGRFGAERRRGRQVGRAVRLGVHRRQRLVGSQQTTPLPAHVDRRLGNERAVPRQAVDHRGHSPRTRHLHDSGRPNGTRPRRRSRRAWSTSPTRRSSAAATIRTATSGSEAPMTAARAGRTAQRSPRACPSISRR